MFNKNKNIENIENIEDQEHLVESIPSDFKILIKPSFHIIGEYWGKLEQRYYDYDYDHYVYRYQQISFTTDSYNRAVLSTGIADCNLKLYEGPIDWPGSLWKIGDGVSITGSNQFHIQRLLEAIVEDKIIQIKAEKAKEQQLQDWKNSQTTIIKEFNVE